MGAIDITNDEVDGRAAADRLAHEWDNRDWVPDAPTVQWARGAVKRLGEIIAAQPSMLRASMKGGGKGASTLSPRPFQGLVECLQNADDLGATCLHVAYRESPSRELLIAHDGSPVTLANVGAMLLPWLSTKDDDPEASGRFGIGQRTLSSLGGPFAMHAAPFHFVMGDDGPEPCEPQPDVAGIYSTACRDTMLVIPLLESVTGEGVAEAIRQLDVDALIFLKSIRALRFRNIGDPSQDLDFAVGVTPAGDGKIAFANDTAVVEIADVHILAPHEEATGRHYRRYSTRRPLAIHCRAGTRQEVG